MWWHKVTHGWESEGETGEWIGYPVPFTLPRNTVYPALLPLMAHTSATSSRPNWCPPPGRFKWTRPFLRTTKSGFCACAITFQLASTSNGGKKLNAALHRNKYSWPLNVSVFYFASVIGVLEAEADRCCQQCFGQTEWNTMCILWQWISKFLISLFFFKGAMMYATD